jgi:hypothetical protein
MITYKNLEKAYFCNTRVLIPKTGIMHLLIIIKNHQTVYNLIQGDSNSNAIISAPELIKIVLGCS